MSESLKEQTFTGTLEPQCQYFVMRKKRLCRMTVRPGRQYCGEHEPQPKTADGQDDARIPCPNDPKHTVYVSKLEKHLSICNARVTEQPPYIVQNINAPTEIEICMRLPLSQLSRDVVIQVVEKINLLYDKHVKDNITVAPEHPIHRTVMEEFSESDRTESSLRHLRQLSSLLWLAEDEGLVADNTCYVELGAGKGHMSYYLCSAWCAAGAGAGAGASGALLVDRAALRHKREQRAGSAPAPAPAHRLRADLAHLELSRVPLVAASAAVVGLAKHLCGVATDYALRCLTAEGVVQKARGAVLATCCHHRCERAAFVANRQLQELGISGDELNVMLGIVSWATCGDGRSRDARAILAAGQGAGLATAGQGAGLATAGQGAEQVAAGQGTGQAAAGQGAGLTAAGQGAGQALAGQGAGQAAAGQGAGQAAAGQGAGLTAAGQGTGQAAAGQGAGLTAAGQGTGQAAAGQGAGQAPSERLGAALTQEQRAQAGRRAKQLLDWARVLYLRGRGFDARLCYYVPTTVSLENVCIVAKKIS